MTACLEPSGAAPAELASISFLSLSAPHMIWSTSRLRSGGSCVGAGAPSRSAAVRPPSPREGSAE